MTPAERELLLLVANWFVIGGRDEDRALKIHQQVRDLIATIKEEGSK